MAVERRPRQRTPVPVADRLAAARETCGRAAAVVEGVRFTVGEPPAALDALDLSLGRTAGTDGEAESARRVALGMELIGRRMGVSDRRVQAAFLHGWYTWFVLGPLFAVYLAERRVLAIPASHTALRWDGSDVASVWLAEPSLTVLPGDPVAGSPGILVVDDAVALRGALHDQIVGHLEPVIEAIARHSGLGRRMQWLQTADRVAGTLPWLGELLGDEPAARTEAEALISRTGSPLRSPATRFVVWNHAGVERTVAHRASCCLSYRTEAGATCMTCPLSSEAEQAERIHVWMASDA